MAFNYDVTTTRGLVRLLISDVDTSNAANQVFTDAEIDAFLGLSGGLTVFGAAALALRAIAGNEVQTLKVLRSLDLQTDGRATADALRSLAESYEAKAEEELGPAGGFEVGEMANNVFQVRERLIKESMRTGV